MLWPTPMLPHIIPFLSVRVAGLSKFENPGKEAADNIAEAINVFFENCRLSIIRVLSS
jgi:hypothetical protein